MLNKREGPTHSIVVLPNIFWHVGVDEFGLLINMNLILMNIMWRHTFFPRSNHFGLVQTTNIPTNGVPFFVCCP